MPATAEYSQEGTNGMPVDSTQESSPHATAVETDTEAIRALKQRVMEIALSVNKGEMKDAVAILKTCKRSVIEGKFTSSFQPPVNAEGIRSPELTSASTTSPFDNDLMGPSSEDGDQEDDRECATNIDVDFDGVQAQPSLRPSAQMTRPTVQYEESSVPGSGLFCCSVNPKSHTDRWGFLSVFAQAQSPSVQPVKTEDTQLIKTK